MIGRACAKLALRHSKHQIKWETVEDKATVATFALTYSSATSRSGILGRRIDDKAVNFADHLSHSRDLSLSTFFCILRQPQIDHRGSLITLYTYGSSKLVTEVD